MASEDRGRAVAGVFRLINATEDEHLLRWRGLDPSRRYRVTVEPGGLAHIADGATLMERGMTIRLDTALTSRLILCQAQ